MRSNGRFAGILTNKNKSWIHERSRKLSRGWMLNMMGHRNRKTCFNFFHLADELRTRQLRTRSSPDIVRAAPYTDSETEKPVSSFGVEQRPSKTRGRWEMVLKGPLIKWVILEHYSLVYFTITIFHFSSKLTWKIRKKLKGNKSRKSYNP